MEVGLRQPLSFVFPKASWKEEDCLSPLSVEVVQYAMLKVVIVPCTHASKSIWELLKPGFYYYNEKDAGDETKCHLESTDAIHFSYGPFN